MVKKKLRLALLFVFILMLFASPMEISAQDPEPWNFLVNDTRDLNDYGHNDVCDAIYGNVGEECTLRAAIHEANLCQGSICPDGVTIQVPPGTYTLTIPPVYPNDNSTGSLDITPPNELDLFVIEGTDPAHPSIIDANGLDRVIQIGNSTTQVILRNLVIRGGYLTLTASDHQNKIGAGISNRGLLTLENVVIEDNHINCVPSDYVECYTGVGGGLFSTSQLTINTSTLRDNSAIRGGGIFYNGSAQSRILNSTISGNEAVQTGGGIENYGQILIQNSTISDNEGAGTGGITNTETMNLYNVTIASNISTGGSAANVGNSGTFTIWNSIIAYPISPYVTSNCENSGIWAASGKNLYSDVSCGTGANILSNTDPKLTPLAMLGGATMTRGLFKGSPAHNAVIGFCADYEYPTLTYDQRGANRDSHCDLGAFEGEVYGIYLPTIRR